MKGIVALVAAVGLAVSLRRLAARSNTQVHRINRTGTRTSGAEQQ